MAKVQKGEATAKIDAVGIDNICALIVDGHSQTVIAKGLGVSLHTLSDWIGSDGERSARVREARVSSAEAWFDKGQEYLLDKSMDVGRARELAQHCRKKAAVLKPSEYGDKMELSGDVSFSNRDPMSLESFHFMSNLMVEAHKRYLAAKATDPTVIELDRIYKPELGNGSGESGQPAAADFPPASGRGEHP